MTARFAPPIPYPPGDPCELPYHRPWCRCAAPPKLCAHGDHWRRHLRDRNEKMRAVVAQRLASSATVTG